MKRLYIALAAIYALAAIATFGQAAEASRAACNDRGFCGSDMQVLSGLFGGAFWPLWWSWELAVSYGGKQ